MTSTGDFLHDNAGDYAPAAKFKRIGDEAKGVVTGVNLYTGMNLEETAEETLLIVTLDDEGDQVAVWFKPGGDAIRKLGRAVKEAKPDERRPTVQEGDHVRVVFISEEPSQKKGFNPRKVYEVDYEPGNPDDVPALRPEDLT